MFRILHHKTEIFVGSWIKVLLFIWIFINLTCISCLTCLQTYKSGMIHLHAGLALTHHKPLIIFCTYGGRTDIWILCAQPSAAGMMLCYQIPHPVVVSLFHSSLMLSYENYFWCFPFNVIMLVVSVLQWTLLQGLRLWVFFICGFYVTAVFVWRF